MAVLKKGTDAKVVARNQVQHSTDTVVARNKKTVTADAVLITQEQQIKNIKKELADAKKLHSKLYGKNFKNSVA